MKTLISLIALVFFAACKVSGAYNTEDKAPVQIASESKSVGDMPEIEVKPEELTWFNFKDSQPTSRDLSSISIFGLKLGTNIQNALKSNVIQNSDEAKSGKLGVADQDKPINLSSPNKVLNADKFEPSFETSWYEPEFYFRGIYGKRPDLLGLPVCRLTLYGRLDPFNNLMELTQISVEWDASMIKITSSKKEREVKGEIHNAIAALLIKQIGSPSGEQREKNWEALPPVYSAWNDMRRGESLTLDTSTDRIKLEWLSLKRVKFLEKAQAMYLKSIAPAEPKAGGELK